MDDFFISENEEIRETFHQVEGTGSMNVKFLKDLAAASSNLNNNSWSKHSKNTISSYRTKTIYVELFPKKKREKKLNKIKGEFLQNIQRIIINHSQKILKNLGRGELIDIFLNILNKNNRWRRVNDKKLKKWNGLTFFKIFIKKIKERN